MTSFFLMSVVNAYRLLYQNPLRSCLSISGLVVGLAGLIVIISIEAGAKSVVASQVRSMGENVMVVLPGVPRHAPVRVRHGGVDILTMGDASALKQEIPALKATCGMRQSPGQIVLGNRNWRTFVIGMNPECVSVREWEFLSGGRFDQAEMQGATAVVLLGKTTADALAVNGEDLVGSLVSIKGVSFRVIGVLFPKGHDLDGDDQDNIALVPFFTAERRLYRTRLSGAVDWIAVSAYEREDFPALVQRIREILRARHRLADEVPDDFTILTQSEVAALEEGLDMTLAGFLMVIAALAMVIGGAGIMNVLLVSLSERIPEIGLRMAVGAKRWQIGVQFFTEAGLICSVAGVTGILVGVAGAWIASVIVGWPSVVSGTIALLSFLGSIAMGMAMGVYPAIRASRLNPIEALRYE